MHYLHLEYIVGYNYNTICNKSIILSKQKMFVFWDCPNQCPVPNSIAWGRWSPLPDRTERCGRWPPLPERIDFSNGSIFGGSLNYDIYGQVKDLFRSANVQVFWTGYEPVNGMPQLVEEGLTMGILTQKVGFVESHHVSWLDIRILHTLQVHIHFCYKIQC